LGGEALANLVVSKMPSLQESLGIEGCGLAGAAGGRAAARLLEALPQLWELGLSGNDELGAEGLLALAEDLPRSNVLRLLDLQDCGLVGARGGSALASLVQALPLLQELDLERIPDFSAEGISTFLREGPSVGSQLCSISFGECGLAGPVDGRLVGAALAEFLAP